MAAFLFTATRSLAAGYTPGDLVLIQLKLKSATRQTSAIKDVHVSLGGYRSTRLQRIEESYSLQTIPIRNAVVSPETENYVDLARMFLDSVLAGEEFTAEIYGDAIDSGSETYQLDGDYSESPSLPDRYSFDFRIVKIP